MSTFDTQRLLTLLPAVYRLRDAQQSGYDPLRGGPLEALLAVLAEEIAGIEENIAQLYDDQFIETCADWVVPYIGDLVGQPTLPLSSSLTRFATGRAEVANTITYRRRKGTAAILEQLARDVTGWPARLIEYFQLLCTTQHVNHVRLQVALPDLRRMPLIERVGTPFDATVRTLDVRSIASRRGRYNIPNIGVVLWRLNPYDVESAAPRVEASAPDRRFRFSPLGLDTVLLNSPRVESDALGFVNELNLPDPLPRRALARELDARRAALVNSDDVVRFFFADEAPFAISVAGVRVPDDQVLICDLSTWTAIPATRDYRRRSDDVLLPRAIGVAVDPVLGRFAFPAAVNPAQVRVSYTYGFGADLGGGPYDRSDSVTQWLDPVRRPVSWQVGVSKDAAALATSTAPHSIIVDSVADALAAWKTHVNANPGAFGVIALMDSSSYEEALTGADRIEVPAGARLALVAADWPRADVLGPGGPFRPRGGLTPSGLRPHVRGDISMCGTTAPDEVLPDGSTQRRLPGELILDGLLIEGEVRVLVGNLGRLELRHCTVVPSSGGVAVNGSVQPELQNATLVLQLERAIVGAITLPESVWSLLVSHTSVAGAIAAPGAQLEIVAATLLNTTDALTLEASDALFAQPVNITRRQQGCVRFSYVPTASLTPRKFRCQPELAVSQLTDATLAAETRKRMAPVFVSLNYGDANYARLAQRAALELRTGASDGAELGAYHWVKQPQREANLRLRLREHLRVGLEAGFFYRT